EAHPDVVAPLEGRREGDELSLIESVVRVSDEGLVLRSIMPLQAHCGECSGAFRELKHRFVVSNAFGPLLLRMRFVLLLDGALEKRGRWELLVVACEDERTT